jgi:hypothetical protein
MKSAFGLEPHRFFKNFQTSAICNADLMHCCRQPASRLERPDIIAFTLVAMHNIYPSV